MAGLVGAQRAGLMEGIFVVRSTTEGTVMYKGKELKISRPRDAIQRSIAMLTEDRRATGIFGVLPVDDNVSIASLDRYLEMGLFLNDGKNEQLVQDNVAKLSIKTPSTKTLISSLSGGNQQKVLISAGWPMIRTSSSWMSPPAASTWAPITKSIPSLPRWPSGVNPSS